MKGIAGTGSLAIPYAFSKVCLLLMDSPLGWYHTIDPPFCPGLCYDGYCNISTVRHP